MYKVRCLLIAQHEIQEYSYFYFSPTVTNIYASVHYTTLLLWGECSVEHNRVRGCRQVRDGKPLNELLSFFLAASSFPLALTMGYIQWVTFFPFFLFLYQNWSHNRQQPRHAYLKWMRSNTNPLCWCWFRCHRSSHMITKPTTLTRKKV